MEKTIRILALVLAVQVVLAVGLQFSGPTLSPATEAEPLVSKSSDQVSKITIADAEDQQVKLKRTDSGWTLTDSGFPADPDKVSQLLKQLTGLSEGEVVAQTESARERFKVAGENFKRRITLHTGGQDPVRLYLGTSPGKDRVHARVEGRNPIQVVQFGTYDAPVKVADWQDKGVLQIPSDRITGLQLNGLKLQRKESKQGADKDGQTGQPAGWQASKTPEGKVLQPSAMRQLTQQLATLRFDSVLGAEQPGGYDWDQPVLELTVQRGKEDPVQYRLAKKSVKEDQTKYALKSSTHKEYFSLATPTATQLIEAASAKALLGPEAEKESPDQSGEQDKGRDQAPSSGS